MQKNCKLFFVISLILLFSKPVSAQFHFMPATVWFRTGDSADVWIDAVSLYRQSNRLRLKYHADDEQCLFLDAQQVSAFQFQKEERYIGYYGKLDSAHLYLVSKRTSWNPSYIDDAIFLKPICEGKMCLYEGTDSRGVHHFFFSKEGKPIEELHYSQMEWATKNINKGIFELDDYHCIEHSQYKQQMLVAFSDCLAVYRQLAVANVHFNKPSLSKWFRSYNNELKNSNSQVNAAGVSSQ